MTRNTLKSILEGVGFTVVQNRSSDEEITFVCPERGCGDRTGHRSVNVRTLKTNCFKCGNGGNFYKWARHLGIEIEAGEELAPTVDELEDLTGQLNAPPPKPVVFSGIQLPAGFQLLHKNRSSYQHKWISRMAKRKNLEVEDFERARAGYVEEGEWDGYCIFPVHEWGVLSYYQGRTYNENPGERTKKFPSRTVCPAGMRNWVYNIDEARTLQSPTIIIVESILNVLSLKNELQDRGIEGVTPVAVFKHSISWEQAAKLAGLKHCQEMNLMFDPDATAAAWRSVKSQSSIPITRFSITEMPWEIRDDGKKKGIDANDNASLAMDLYAERQSASGSLRDLDLALALL